MKVFTVYDSKAEAYLPPFMERASGSAIRAFEAAVNNPDHQFNHHPGDYTLFEIGTFDDQTGRYNMLDAFVNLGAGLEFSKVQVTPLPEKTEIE